MDDYYDILAPTKSIT